MTYRTLLLDALRLHFDEHLSRLDVGRRLGIPKSTICDLFVRFKKQEVSWPLPDSMTSDKLESLLYPARITADIIETSSQLWWKSPLRASGSAARIFHMNSKSRWLKNHCNLVPMWHNWRGNTALTTTCCLTGATFISEDCCGPATTAHYSCR